MNLIEKTPPIYRDNVIPFPTPVIEKKKRTTSPYKSNGVPKATAADPIRNQDHIALMQEYYLSRNKIRNYTIFTLGISFGLRASDLLDMKIYNLVNLDGSIKTHCDIYEIKTRKHNNPAITPKIKSIIESYLATLGEYSTGDYMFRSQKKHMDGSSKPLTIQQLNNIIKDAAKACGVPGNISTHSLRKTFAYHLLKQNPDSDEAKFALQKMLNHDSFKTTLTYCGLAQDSIDKFRGGIDDIL